jgi:16S rRNA (cytosine967-C5)-methyltransferase
MKISPARIAAFEILGKIEREKAFSSALLPLYEENLSIKDRALCHEITLGVLRRRIYLDALIENLTRKKIEKLDLAVAVALRIGLYQLLFLDRIPAYSAINESVNLVQKAKKTSAKGFVNAILRRVLREKIELEFADETEKLSVETSHPRWLLEKWIERFGFEETSKLAQANNEMPKLAFRPTANFKGRDAEPPGFFQKSEFVENCFLAEKIDAGLLESAEKGEIYFQDEASQMVAGLVEIKENEKFLDVCAAPGSKTTLIAQRATQPAELIAAGDFYDHRVRTLRENCLKQGVGFVRIVRYDAEKSLPFAENAFEWILVDAPCSGTGTIRHNPEIKYFLAENDLAELAAKQLAILKNASKLVKAGGRLIYSTCSLELEENERVVENFLAEAADFEKYAPPVPARFLTADNFARTFPQRDEMDGFFIAAFKKSG